MSNPDRDLLRLWADWWNGPGRRAYHGNILPPLERTAEALTCLACKGCLPPGETCEACGRIGRADVPFQT